MCANNPLVNQPMSIKKFIRELFSFKVLFIASFRLDSSAKGQKQLCLDVKPYKNGACCPECGRRGKIIPSSTLQSRRWRDITCAGASSGCTTDQEKSSALPTAVLRKLFRGQLGTRVLLSASNISCSVSAP